MTSSVSAALSAIEAMSREELIAAIDKYIWWHSIDLGGGVMIRGTKDPRLMATEIANTFSPIDVRGKSVLDVGAWNGGFAVEAVRRGASRVVALDHYTWNHEQFKGRETLELVRRITGLQIDAVDIDLDEATLCLGDLGEFDIVLFLGVFYHLKNPLSALAELARLAREVLVLETHVEATEDPRPQMIFYPGDELAGDPTNWWGPNTACIIGLLKMSGFDLIETRPGSNVTRQVFHARRTT